MFNQLKWRPKTKHSVDCSGRGNFHIVIGSLRDVATGWHVAKAVRHMGKRMVGVEKTARSRIDEGDAAWHVRKHLLVENHFTLQPLLGVQLPLVICASQPGEYRGENDQPGRKYRHSS